VFTVSGLVLLAAAIATLLGVRTKVSAVPA